MGITGNDPHGGLDRENLADSLDQRRGIVDHIPQPVVGSLAARATHEDEMEPALSASTVGG